MKNNLSREEQLYHRLKQLGLTVTSAESCTGGLIAGTIINVAGASDIFSQGYITYSQDAKEKILGVSLRTMATFGVVSAQTAKEMASGAARIAGASVSLSSTGLAGPGGETEKTPLGLVNLACLVSRKTTVRVFIFSWNRGQFRALAVQEALQLALDCLSDEETDF